MYVCACARFIYPRDRGGRVVHATRPSTTSIPIPTREEGRRWRGVHFKSAGAARLILVNWPLSSGVCGVCCGGRVILGGVEVIFLKFFFQPPGGWAEGGFYNLACFLIGKVKIQVR